MNPSAPTRAQARVDARVLSALPHESGWRFADVLGGVNTAPSWKHRHLSADELAASLTRLEAAGRATSAGGWWRGL